MMLNNDNNNSNNNNNDSDSDNDQRNENVESFTLQNWINANFESSNSYFSMFRDKLQKEKYWKRMMESQNCIYNPVKKLWWKVNAKIVNDF